jgi:hypothetical protein
MSSTTVLHERYDSELEILQAFFWSSELLEASHCQPEWQPQAETETWPPSRAALGWLAFAESRHLLELHA